MKKFMLISLATASLLMGADIKFNEASQDVTRVSPLSDKNSVLSYYDSIAQAKLSVVNISTTKMVASGGIEQMFNDPFFNEFFGFNFAADWKGFDFSMMLQGVIDNANKPMDDPMVQFFFKSPIGDGDAPVLEISQGIAGEEPFEDSVVEQND